MRQNQLTIDGLYRSKRQRDTELDLLFTIYVLIYRRVVTRRSPFRKTHPQAVGETVAATNKKHKIGTFI